VAAVAAPAVVSAVPVQAGAAVAAGTPDTLTCPAPCSRRRGPMSTSRPLMTLQTVHDAAATLLYTYRR
jgi:hypothetical protein